VNVVALDWKWLFIYPDYGVATVNELAAPVDTTIDMNITSSSVMNSLYIPALAGQVYAMPAMQTQLHAVMNRTGEYQGFSANYSGAGFSGMHFQFHSLTQGDFQKWIAEVKAGGDTLGRRDYLELERPSENVPAHRYATVDPGLYYAIVNMCVEAGKMCMSDMMAYDAHGGGSRLTRPQDVRAALEYDKYARRGAAVATPAAGASTGAAPTAGVIPAAGPSPVAALSAHAASP
jgi:cytochrome o ubiquinol oxidase subunit 2